MSDFKLVKLLDPITVTNVSGGLTPRGAYNSSVMYNVGDEVSYNGSSYVLYVTAPAGTLPTDTSKWSVLASKGDTGAVGPSGTGDKNYTQAINSASSVSVTHNLSKYPSVTVFDSSGDRVEGDINYSSLNTLTVSFSASFSGTITLN